MSYAIKVYLLKVRYKVRLKNVVEQVTECIDCQVDVSIRNLIYYYYYCCCLHLDLALISSPRFLMSDAKLQTKLFAYWHKQINIGALIIRRRARNAVSISASRTKSVVPQ